MPPSSFESSDLALRYLDEVHFFETMRAYDGEVFLLNEHLKRLHETCHSAGQLADVRAVEGWLKESLKKSSYENALLRLSWHPQKSGGQWTIIIREFKNYPEDLFKKGVSLRTVTPRRWTSRAQDPQLKASQYVSGVLAYNDMQGQNFHELIFFSEQGLVAEGSVSNVFIIKQKRLLTPPSASGILKGVTRDFVLCVAKKHGFETTERCLTRHELYNAEECFMTNTSSEILPVVEIDKRGIGDGKPGPQTLLLRQKFLRERLKK